MKIHGVKLENFMLFDKLETEFSPNINILIGENSTGKTALLKMLYVSEKCWQQRNTDSLEAVFRPECLDISRLTNRQRAESRTSITVDYGIADRFKLSFGGGKQLYISPTPKTPPADLGKMVYIPTREMISAMENFASLYEKYHISFDETCYDLVRLLDLPQKRELPEALETVKESLEKSIGGTIIQKGKAFFLNMKDVGTLEMDLVSDGYRKLATLLALLGSGALSDDSILFWDEPETNMNPRMVKTLVDALLAVAGAGVQVFVTTHNYFVQQYFGLAAAYKEKYGENLGKLEFRFLSLYREDVEGEVKAGNTVKIESAARLVDLKHNAVTEENDALGDREMGLIYGDDA